MKWTLTGNNWIGMGAVVLCLLGTAGQGQAQAPSPLTITFSHPDQTVVQGTPFIFYIGSLTNTGPDEISLDSDALSLPATDHFFDFAFPASLAAGQTVSNVAFFDLDTGAAASGDVFSGLYSIYATDTATGESFQPASQGFTATISPLAAVPELSSAVSLGTLVMLALGGYALTVRKRLA